MTEVNPGPSSSRQLDVREGLQKIASQEDTIVALATPMGRSGIGVVRISGPLVTEIAEAFLSGGKPLEAQVANVRQWKGPEGELLDTVVAVLFRGPRSYTGEDVLEISGHGNPLVLHCIVQAIQDFGARVAGPGEFTLRAVANGKMDLIQAEAVRDFIEAQTASQLRTARQQLEGAISRKVAPVHKELVRLIAFLEAGIDFAQDDIEAPDGRRIAERLGPMSAALEDLQETYKYGRILGRGVRIAIVGKPNVGKSSIFNRLLNSERAIVTEIPGTTRDILTETVDIAGVPVRLLDTAGIREATDVVESIGVDRALEALVDADLALFVVDASKPLTTEDRKIYERVRELPHLVVANKGDLDCWQDPNVEAGSLRISAKTADGLDLLKEELGKCALNKPPDSLIESVLTSARQSDALIRTIKALRKAETALTCETPQEMVLLDLYEGLAALNELTGETTSEDILGTIFSTFCIGK